MLMYNRFCEVIIGDLKLGGYSEFVDGSINEPINIGINIEHTINQTPNEAEITIYNASPETQREIEVEGTQVEIIAGYKNTSGEYLGTIFKGTTRRSTTVIEGGKDVVTKISCGDADNAYKYSRISRTYEAGENDPMTLATDLAGIFEENLVEIGVITIDGPPDERGTTLDRPVRLELDDLSRRYNSHWTIHNNLFYLWPRAEPIIPEPLLVLSQEFGLVEAPQPTETGVRIKTLLIWELIPGHLIELKATEFGRSRNIDGLYRIESLTHSGELLRGKFISDIVCRKYEGEVQSSENQFSAGGGT